ncbi:acyl-[acyl-carrier-protein]--UDP-N-acetylglucosamine O-acyltransferase [Elstera cyanobacteriorum]|uniref:Acyl-[acyl-carrier-protein]--UDP-N-acetylglucosamine O-acyltransferase n=1 Tax=Elstera cyanobacteriorum TaxID=2022747 RepID=A0A255XN75_9PROT|nr:acyl-ACP--UDP-N-acetylglucosamine O-acyltransferase [Elstera cyanobacteriorum]OYQ18433.1 acyl-[acyl-carrier-protein]--UDP-N-acetylglucosamine O-acyltransferase [Elstera cyanobacteriorum]GFZ80300.1 acyl-[acyl-carrier-protein]--UDP-N-acetylglucosamine O-acyltransferase [Elstera cyanobacteriorum]
MTLSIHPTAIIEEGARLGADIAIGPYCHIGPNVVLGDGVELKSHVVIGGHTSIGAGTVLFPFATIGMPPQHARYKGEEVHLHIGANCVIREHVTMHPGTPFGSGETRVGDNGLFMVGVHIAHDCRVGNNVVMANQATLGGHVEIGDFVNIGGMSAVHQFVRIGKHAMVGGMSGVEGDVIPYGMVMGDRARLSGLNIVGLKRRGFEREEVHALRAAYRLLFAAEGTMAERLEDVSGIMKDNAAITDIVEFIRADSTRAICHPR